MQRLLPPPRIGETRVEVASGFPSQYPLCFGGIGVDGGHVSVAAGTEGVRDGESRGPFKAMEHIQHTGALASAQVEGVQ